MVTALLVVGSVVLACFDLFVAAHAILATHRRVAARMRERGWETGVAHIGGIVAGLAVCVAWPVGLVIAIREVASNGPIWRRRRDGSAPIPPGPQAMTHTTVGPRRSTKLFVAAALSVPVSIVLAIIGVMSGALFVVYVAMVASVLTVPLALAGLVFLVVEQNQRRADDRQPRPAGPGFAAVTDDGIVAVARGGNGFVRRNEPTTEIGRRVYEARKRRWYER